MLQPIIKVLRKLLAFTLREEALRQRNKASLVVISAEAVEQHCAAKEAKLQEALFNARAERLEASKRVTKAICASCDYEKAADLLDGDAVIVEFAGRK